MRDVEIIKRELPLDVLESFFLTPLPGSRSQEVARRILPRHQQVRPRSSRFPSRENVGTPNGKTHIGRRGTLTIRPSTARSCGGRRTPNGRPKQIAEHHHVVQAHDRARGRPSAERPRVSAQVAARPPAQSAIGIALRSLSALRLRSREQGLEVLAIFRSQHGALAPNRTTYTDLAIDVPRDDEFEQLSLYHATSGGEAALVRKALGDSIRDAARPHNRRNVRDAGAIIPRR